jgi:hypothetical protein
MLLAGCSCEGDDQWMILGSADATLHLTAILAVNVATAVVRSPNLKAPERHLGFSRLGLLRG